MKLWDIAMKMNHPGIKVQVIHHTTRRVCFSGTADGLLDYSGLDFMKVKRIDAKDDTLLLYVLP